MRDEGLEFPAQWIPLDPIDHESAVACTGRNPVLGVDEGEVVIHVFPAVD